MRHCDASNTRQLPIAACLLVLSNLTRTCYALATSDVSADMIDVAWASAIEDWESDTRGRHRLDFACFHDSVFELACCYADEHTAASYARFLKDVSAPRPEFALRMRAFSTR